MDEEAKAGVTIPLRIRMHRVHRCFRHDSVANGVVLRLNIFDGGRFRRRSIGLREASSSGKAKSDCHNVSKCVLHAEIQEILAD